MARADLDRLRVAAKQMTTRFTKAQILDYLVDNLTHRRQGEAAEILLPDGRKLRLAHVPNHANVGETITILSIS